MARLVWKWSSYPCRSWSGKGPSYQAWPNKTWHQLYRDWHPKVGIIMPDKVLVEFLISLLWVDGLWLTNYLKTVRLRLSPKLFRSWPKNAMKKRRLTWLKSLIPSSASCLRMGKSIQDRQSWLVWGQSSELPSVWGWDSMVLWLTCMPVILKATIRCIWAKFQQRSSDLLSWREF